MIHSLRIDVAPYVRAWVAAEASRFPATSSAWSPWSTVRRSFPTGQGLWTVAEPGFTAMPTAFGPHSSGRPFRGRFAWD